MLLDLDKTNIRLENTTNKMLSLKNIQFMETKVQDDIDSTTNTAFDVDNNTASGCDNKFNKVSIFLLSSYNIQQIILVDFEYFRKKNIPH